MSEVNTRSIRLLFYFLAVTSFGSNLSALATFLTIESSFGSNLYIAQALAAKTIVMLFASYLAPALLASLEEKGALILSQLAGLVSIIGIFCGFYFAAPYVVIASVGLTGLPLTWLNVAVISELRQLNDEQNFVRHSAHRTKLLGIIFLISALIAPLALKSFGLNAILAFDALTFIVSALILIFLPNFEKPHVEIKPKLNVVLEFARSVHSKAFLIPMIALTLFSGLIPLSASSTSFSFSQGWSGAVRGQLWSLEAIAMILVGLIYPRVPHKQKFFALTMVSSLILLPYVIYPSATIGYALLGLYSLGCMLGFQFYRDQMVIQSGPDARKAAAFSEFIRSILLAASPLLLVFLDSEFELSSVIVIFIFQFILLGMFLIQRQFARL